MNKIFVIESKKGKYLVMTENLMKGSLDATNSLIDGRILMLFGLTKFIKANGFGYTHPENMGKSENEVRIKTFKNLIDSISKIADDAGITYVLINILENEDCGTYWLLTANYQFLIRQ